MFEMLLGHLVGDYLLQNHWLAMNKTKNSFQGWGAAVIHCLIYTLAVTTIMWNFDWIWIVAVFASHFFIDKFGLAEYYMHYIKGYGMKDFVEKNKMESIPHEPHFNRPKKITSLIVLEGGFVALIYAVTDNTMHLVLMWGAYNLIY